MLKCLEAGLCGYCNMSLLQCDVEMTIPNFSEPWSDRKKWVMGLIAALIVLAVGALIFQPLSSFIISSENDSAEKRQSVQPRQPANVLTKSAEGTERQETFGPLSLGPGLDELLTTLKNQDFTELQKQQFVRQSTGLIVQWEIEVLGAEQIDVALAGFILITFRSPSDEEMFPEILVARFPASAEANLAPIGRGDKIVVVGRLRIDSRGFDAFDIALEDCKLVTWTKQEKE